MKKYTSQMLLASLLALFLTLTSCQEGFEDTVVDGEQTIEAQSAMASLIERTTSNDGSFDNIVDRSSCFQLKFPYTLKLNGLELIIKDMEGLELLEEVLDELIDDEEVMQSVEDVRELMEIVFPVTIVLPDYSEVTIHSLEELREHAEECIEGGDDEDIECIDFVYPITLFTFNANLEQMDSVTVENDSQLRRFFKNLQPGTFAGFDFPIKLKLYDGTIIEVNSNAELAAAIEGAIHACDEDDDDDHNDDDFTKDRFDELLMSCPWLVHEVHRDDVDQTEQYFEYLMVFEEDQKVTVKDRNGNLITGDWSTHMGDQGVILKMEFDVLVDFNLEWFVYEIQPGKIKLYNGEGNRIRLYKACEHDKETAISELREILKECKWTIRKVLNEGEEIERLLGYSFKFMADGVVTLGKGDELSEGSWDVGLNSEGILSLHISFGNDPEVSFEWPVRKLLHERLEFEIEGTGYELILERVCEHETNDDDIDEIEGTLESGDWSLAKYKVGENDLTPEYTGFGFRFGEDGKIGVMHNQEMYIGGEWKVYRNSDGQLKVGLDFHDNVPLDKLNGDWDFVSMSDDRMELKVIKEDGTEVILVFEN